MMEFKNFIWDFDGTLFNSYPHIATAFCIMLSNNNIEHTYKNVLDDLQVTFDYAFKKYNLNELQIKEFRSYTNNPVVKPEIVPYNDADDILKYILNNGGTNYIYTHRNTETLTRYLQKYIFSHYFSGIVTSDYGFKKKPSSEGIEYIIKEYTLDKDKTVMIGDRELDVLSGLGAGIQAGLVVRNKKNIKTDANYVFTDLTSVRDIIGGN